MTREIVRLRNSTVSERGGATLEFLLALPLLACAFTILLQLAMLLQIKMVLHYASFCAARSGAVWLQPPASAGQLIEAESHDPAQAQVRALRAAAIALVPVSPPAGMLGGGETGPTVVASSGNAIAGEVLGQLARKREHWAYALNATHVDLTMETLEASGQTVQLASAKVRYTAFLFVPVAGRLLGWASPPEGMHSGWGGFADLESSCSVVLEREAGHE